MYQQILDLINLNLASGTEIPALKHREVEVALLDFINENLPKQFDIKYIWVDSIYLGDNFEANGLGKSLRLGWALCNGTTHSGVPTPDLSGKMIMSYGGYFNTLNAIGGSKDAVVVSHSHNTNTNISFGSGDGIVRQKVQSFPGGTGSLIITEETGVSGTDKNMPPYITLIAIMKL